MRKINVAISALLISGVYHAQTDTENYIQTRIYLEPVSQTSNTAKQMREVQYFDGLGRMKQVVNVKASPSQKDIVTPIVYDAYGRQSREYLPIPQSSTNNGLIYPQNPGLVPFPVNDNANIYGGNKIFTEKKFGDSALDRVSEQTQVGDAWSSKPVKFEYSLNIDGEVRNYIATFDYTTFQANIIISGTYGANQLYKSTLIDEDGNKTIEFKNGLGQIILIRKVISASENADTYYVYNDYDQLAFVIPPLAAVPQSIDSSLLNNLCYQYKYDNKNRLVEKKTPGKGWELMVYDKQDRVILTQDAVLGSTTNNFAKKGWIFNKYDQFGRIVYTGFFANSATRIAMQTAINNMNSNTGNNESRVTTPFTLNGIDLYYTKNAFPTGSMTILSVNYYDTYPPMPAGVTIPPFIINSNQTVLQDTTGSVNTKSLPVATYLKNIDDDNWTKAYMWYDFKGKIIGTHSVNYLGGTTRKEFLADFTGNIKESYTHHKRTANDPEVTVTEIFDHDHENRLLTHKHKINNGNLEPIKTNTYNELSQISNKKIGLDDDGNPLQSIDYEYNIRGWLTAINNPSNLGNSIFGMKIKYQDPQDGNYGIAKYNGNISEIDWKTSLGDGIYRRYAYQYDKLNRLTDGIYLTPNMSSDSQNHYYDEKISYDINGNIKTLNRYKNPPTGQTTPLQIDELAYEYEVPDQSNKLIKITDNKSNPSGYPVGGNTIGYDANGNMINHMDKQVKDIKYNYLNLPTLINAVAGGGLMPSMNEGKMHTYKYRSDGAKYATRTDNINPYSIEYSETNYIDNFQYERMYSKMSTSQNAYDSGFILKFIPTSEGFYNFEKKEYIYNFKDHLGSVRYNFAKADGGGMRLLEETNYYPFGLKHEGYNDGFNMAQSGIKYNYKYNGKELQESGMYDYGARLYMPDIGRWGVIDPMAEKDRRWTPYRYAYNNPLLFTDPDGQFETRFGAWWHKTWNGNGKSSEIKYDAKKKEYYYNRLNEAKGNEVNFTAVYSNSKKSAGTFVLQVEGKASFGLQIAFKVPVGSVQAGVMTGDIGKIGWSSREQSNNGFYAKYGDGKGHNFLGGSLKFFNDKLSMGRNVDYVTDDIIPTAGDLLDYYPNHGKFTDEITMGPSINKYAPKEAYGPSVLDIKFKERFRSGNKEECSFCVDLGIAVKVLLGLEGKVRVGFTGAND